VKSQANHLATEDDTPLHNFASAKQQRLLVSYLYSSLQSQTFLVEANVGIYHTDGQPEIFLSLYQFFFPDWRRTR
jgi:hypothetical protein